MRQVTLHIEGMSCGHCLNAVNQALSQVPGAEIESVQMGRATVRYDESRLSPSQLEEAVTNAGYKATAS